jgi:hypothetical protein
MNGAALAERDHFFGDGTRGLGLGQSRRHALVFDQAANEVGQHRVAMFGRAAQFGRSLQVSHKFLTPPSVLPSAWLDQARLKIHAERQAERGQLVFDFVERFLAEVAILEHFLLALHRQLADGGDVRVVQAVRRADAQFDFVDAHVEQLLHLRLLVVLLVGGFLEFNRVLVVTDKHVEVMRQNRRGLRERVIGRERPSVQTSRTRRS